jgi:hypothetical protein
MGAEQQSDAIFLKSAHLDFEGRRLFLLRSDETVLRFSLTDKGILSEILRPQTLEEPISQVPPCEAQTDDVATPAKKTVTLTGKLKSKPQEGRLDRNQKPTAWARLAVHLEGEEQAKMFLASFHRHTRAIALGLSEGDQVTVEGYPRPSADPARMDSLSVFNIPAYPGKPHKTPLPT